MKNNRVLNHLPDCEGRPETYKYFKLHVTDEDTHKPVVGAKVIINKQVSGVTDELGFSKKKCVHKGQVNSTVSKEGYYPSWWISDVEKETVQEVSLEPIEKEHALVQVKVTSDDGEVLENAQVSMGMYDAITREDGVAYLKHVGYGDYDCKVSHKGFKPSTHKVKVDKSIVNTTVCLEGAGESEITILVTNKDNEPVQGAIVLWDKIRLLTNKEGTCNTSTIKGLHHYEVYHPDYLNNRGDYTVKKNKEDLTVVLQPIVYGVADIRVKDKDTGEPLNKAKVTIDCKEYLTNEKGCVTTAKLPYDTYPVIVSMNGYNTESDTVTIDKDKTQKTFSLVCIRKSHVTIRVVDKNGKPISDCFVNLKNKTTNIMSNTNEYGEAKIHDVPFDTYNLTIDHKKYQRVDKQITIEGVTFEEKITMTSSGTGTLEVLVTDYFTKKPVPNAEIKLGNIRKKTDKEGYCILDDITQGEYDLKITADKYTSSKEKKILITEMVEEEIHLIPVDKTVKTLKVKVMDKSIKQPVQSAKVKIIHIGGTEGFEQITNLNGETTLYNLPYGDYTIQSGRFDHKIVEERVTLNNPTHEVTQTLEPTDKMTSLELLITDADNGHLIEGAKVLFGDPKEPTYITNSGAGKIIMPCMRVAGITVHVDHPDYEAFRKNLILTTEPYKETLKIKPATIPVKLSVKDKETGKAVSTAVVDCNNERKVTQSDGIVTYKLKPAEYNVRIQHNRYHTFEQIIKVTKDTNLIELIIIPYTDTDLTVKVINTRVGDGRVENAKVTVGDNVGYTNNVGIVVLEHIKPGKYMINVTKDGFEDYNWETTLVPGKTMFTAPCTSKFTKADWKIIVTDGVKPINSAFVELDKVKITGTTNDKGEVVLKDVPLGNYMVKVTHAGKSMTKPYELADKDITSYYNFN